MTEAELKATPVGFARLILRKPLYGWQAIVLSWFEQLSPRIKAALCTPNGAGKSERVVACLILWFLAVHPLGRVVVTTADGKQLDNQVIPAVWAHQAAFRSAGWKFTERRIDTPTGGWAVFFTTDEEGRAEGWHKVDDFKGPLLIVVDESKTVPEGIFRAIDRCTYSALLLTSSPGLMQGRFYDAFTKDKAAFRTMQVGLKDCPHIPQDRIDDIIARYGPDHPFTRSTLHGEFMPEDEGTQFVFPISLVQGARQSPGKSRPGPIFAFLDFAAGGDENVLAVKRGNVVTIEAAWRDRNTMSAVGRFIVELRKLGIVADHCFGDADGVGHPMLDAMRDAGWDINRVHNGGAARSDAYANRGAEIWHEASQQLRRGEIVLPLEDDALFAQLTTRKAIWNAQGKLGVEKKEEMRKRGLNSPDRGDAVCGVVVAAYSMQPIHRDPFPAEMGWRERFADEREDGGGALAGLNAGW